MNSLGRWVIDTRYGQAAFLTAVTVLVGLAAWLAITTEVGRQTEPLVVRVDAVEQINPCVDGRAATPECQQYVADILGAVPRDLYCTLFRGVLTPDAFAALTRCYTVDRSPRPEGGDAQPSPPASQPPRPGTPGPRTPPRPSPPRPVPPTSEPPPRRVPATPPRQTPPPARPAPERPADPIPGVPRPRVCDLTPRLCERLPDLPDVIPIR